MMKRPSDVNQNATIVVQLATGEVPKDAEERYKPRVNDEHEPRRRERSGPARDGVLTPERRSEIAKKAAAARWGNK